MDYTTSWIGDSFFDHTKNPPQHIPDWLGDLAVSPNGTVFTAGYAESYGGGASYKDGHFAGRYDGFNTGFGSTVDAVAVDSKWVYFGGNNGIQRYPFGGAGSPNQVVMPKTVFLGLAIHDGLLYGSDFTNNKIRVFAADTLTEKANWSALRPGKIAVDRNGRVWVIQLGEKANTGIGYFPGNKIVSFSPNGTPGTSIEDVELPSALAIDEKHNELLVGNTGALENNKTAVDCRIRYYGDLDGQPKLVRTFGCKGGIDSTPSGVHTPARFHRIHGVGLDGEGNLYVACIYGVWWGQTVEAYSQEGKLLWEVGGTDYCDCGTFDPKSETDVFDSLHHYVLDYDKPPGQQWRMAGLTVNESKYPDDPRVLASGNQFHQGIGVRYIQGRKFLFVSEQGGYPLWIFRFNKETDRETAIPSVTFSGGAQEKISRDANGNGGFEPTEIENGVTGYFQYSYVTDDGDVWRIRDDGSLVEYPLQGLDSSGNPIYTAKSAVAWPLPGDIGLKGFSPLRALTYDKASDTMWIGGSPFPEGDCGVEHVVCYNHWKGTEGQTRSLRWTTDLPFKDKSYTPQDGYGGATPRPMRVAGKYIFFLYGMGYVRIHDKDTGAYIGTMIPHLPGFDGGGGQVDAVYGMSVQKRSNGEYVVLTENAGGNHIVMFRWKPAGAVAWSKSPAFLGKS